MILEVQRDPKSIKIAQNREETRPQTLPTTKTFFDHDFFAFLINFLTETPPKRTPKVPQKSQTNTLGPRLGPSGASGVDFGASGP